MARQEASRELSAQPPAALLGPCPFCGHTTINVYAGRAECDRCEARTHGEDDADAVACWNRRAVDPVRAALFEALEQCAESLASARDKLGMCGEGDGQDRKADAADTIGSQSALNAARAAINMARS